MIIDLNSQILPGLGSGSKDMGSAIQILKELRAHGVDFVVATPPYSSLEKSVEAFLEERDDALVELRNELKHNGLAEGVDVPEIMIGTEVIYTPGFDNIEGIEKLCIEDSNKLLLSLPETAWGNAEFTSLVNLIFTKRIDIILAHYELYKQNHKTPTANRILRLPIWVQLSAASFGKFLLKGNLARAIKNDDAQIIATNVYDEQSNAESLIKARQYVETKIGKEAMDKLDEAERKILGF